MPEQPVEPGTQELFSGQMETQASAGDWGDSECPRDLPESSKPPTMFSEEDGSEIPVPKELQYVKNAGVRFSRVEDSVWNLKNSNAKLFKNKSVYFSVDTICTSQDILLPFDRAGFDIDEITSIQRRNSNRSWVVLFRSFEHKETALELNSITVFGIELFLGDAQFRTVLVKIYECPTEMPDTVVVGRLSRFCQVLFPS